LPTQRTGWLDWLAAVAGWTASMNWLRWRAALAGCAGGLHWLAEISNKFTAYH